MPSYISHAIMMEKLYMDHYNDKKIFKNELKLNDLKTYSLGTDLATSSLILRHNPHREYTQDFFLFMAKYIKDNNLTGNDNIISLLYGHIAHYFLDINAHPFIYYIEKSNQNFTLIPSHHLIEGYLDSYLSKKILKKDIMSLNESYFNKGCITKEASLLLERIYQKIYHVKFISLSYKKTLMIFSVLERILKSGLFTKRDLYKITGLMNYLNKNKLNINDLSNENYLYYQNPTSGEYLRNSFLELFYKSIYETLNAIDNVNLYLYNNKSLDELKIVFNNLSYDTGLKCEYGNKMIYIKKK